MRLAFVADGRSTHTQRWLEYFVDRRHEVHLLTTYPVDPVDYRGVTVHDLSLWFRAPDSSQVKRPQAAVADGVLQQAAFWARLVNLDDVVRPLWERWLVLESYRLAPRARRVIQTLQADVVHALRIPIEGYIAALAACHPLVISSWGADFAYWRRLDPLHRALTDRTVRSADAFVADCERDRRTALRIGLNGNRPALLCPGAGGVRFDVPAAGAAEVRRRWDVPDGAAIVIYNRGLGGPHYRLHTFIQAIPLIRRKVPATVFFVLGGAGNPECEALAREAGVSAHLRLLPYLDYAGVLSVLQAAQVMVSPSVHDGTPNSMLEGMRCGCFPVMSDLDSIREWIQPGLNGLVFDPADPAALSAAVIRALRDENLRRAAAHHNRQLIAERAEYHANLARIEALYERLGGGG